MAAIGTASRMRSPVRYGSAPVVVVIGLALESRSTRLSGTLLAMRIGKEDP
jgi:hypothetical protein